ncbi:MAG: PHP domain-containing protein [Clostridia bacterium]|nr:PHP domain-containing protein [Clostridia bacterium]
MMRADFHMHSTASDGVMSPELLVWEARQAGVQWMAITDHDTFYGTDSLREEDKVIPVLPGVELSLRDMPGLHLLAYGTAPAPALRRAVEDLEEKRVVRAREMARKLEALGMPLDFPALIKKRRREGGSHATIGRPHLARALVRAGYVKNMQAAFEQFLGEHGPAYVPCERLSMEEALPLILKSGFVPVIAHPRELKLPDEQLLSLIKKWQGLGLMGLEVYHPSAAAGGFDGLEHMARTLGLLVTGGSDFHMPHDGKHGLIGAMSDEWAGIEADVTCLMEAVREMHRKATEQ